MIHVGSIVELKADCLGNPKGTWGICYEIYNVIPGERGVSIIFENGNYDGFSPDEQRSFLNVIGFDAASADYKFENVIKLSQDFESGVFDMLNEGSRSYGRTR